MILDAIQSPSESQQHLKPSKSTCSNSMAMTEVLATTSQSMDSFTRKGQKIKKFFLFNKKALAFCYTVKKKFL